MGSFHNDDRDGIQKHGGSVTHQLVGSAGAFAALKTYEQHVENTGKPQTYKEAQDLIASLAGKEVDKIIDNKGYNDVDRSKAKHEAREKAKISLENSKEFGPQQYGGHAGGKSRGREERSHEREDEERRAEKRGL